MKKKHKKKLMKLLTTLILMLVVTCVGYLKDFFKEEIQQVLAKPDEKIIISFNLEEIPEFDESSSYVIINDNNPNFKQEDLTTKSFERYSDLDELGRCGVAYANIGKDIMPTEERESIGQIKPTGWRTARYDCIEGNEQILAKTVR